ncbi:hypothetical protein BRC77_09730 [Halobacteriales archaeon QH_8_64_26]|nr:MAG: hypothetical protein BRC77_09730 [Halobacteriales archaeon QH_8_64_26]
MFKSRAERVAPTDDQSRSAVSTIEANSSCRWASAASWLSRALSSTSLGPSRSNVAVASVTTTVSKPRFAAVRAVVETQ